MRTEGVHNLLTRMHSAQKNQGTKKSSGALNTPCLRRGSMGEKSDPCPGSSRNIFCAFTVRLHGERATMECIKTKSAGEKGPDNGESKAILEIHQILSGRRSQAENDEESGMIKYCWPIFLISQEITSIFPGLEFE